MFPKKFESIVEKQRGLALKKLLLRMLETMDVNDEKIKEYSLQYRELVKPKQFIGEGSFEIMYDKDFEATCHTIQGFSKRNIKEMNIVEYYTLVDYAEEKTKNSKQAGGLAGLALLFGA
jgi:hypothetical protein